MTDDELDEPAGAADRITRPLPWSEPISGKQVGVRDPNSKAWLIRAAIQASGPHGTIDAVRAALPTLQFSRSEYYKARRQVFPHLRQPQKKSKLVPAPAVPPRESNVPSPAVARELFEPEEIGEIDLGPDWLSKLVKLACTVEAVGGVPTARRLLDAIETVRGRRL